MNRFFSVRRSDWYRSRQQRLLIPGFMASGNPENPGFGPELTFASQLGSGRVVYESLPLGERERLVLTWQTEIVYSGIYGFRKILVFVPELTFAYESLPLGEKKRLVKVSPTRLLIPGLMSSGNPENPGFAACSAQMDPI
ncbi:hypothetical protein Ddc_21875 [Ditylenchus destructor]|nr:hypothetical protein Ddc_21875 [Ditylenchus destructor]